MKNLAEKGKLINKNLYRQLINFIVFNFLTGYFELLFNYGSLYE